MPYVYDTPFPHFLTTKKNFHLNTDYISLKHIHNLLTGTNTIQFPSYHLAMFGLGGCNAVRIFSMDTG